MEINELKEINKKISIKIVFQNFKYNLCENSHEKQIRIIDVCVQNIHKNSSNGEKKNSFYFDVNLKNVEMELSKIN